MISVNEVTMNFGARMLFDGVTVTFNAGERYGLTGPNGSGKSTFMKIVAHELEPMAGSVHLPRRFGILRQDHTAYDQYRVIDVVMPFLFYCFRLIKCLEVACDFLRGFDVAG